MNDNTVKKTMSGYDSWNKWDLSCRRNVGSDETEITSFCFIFVTRRHHHHHHRSLKRVWGSSDDPLRPRSSAHSCLMASGVPSPICWVHEWRIIRACVWTIINLTAQYVAHFMSWASLTTQQSIYIIASLTRGNVTDDQRLLSLSGMMSTCLDGVHRRCIQLLCQKSVVIYQQKQGRS